MACRRRVLIVLDMETNEERQRGGLVQRMVGFARQRPLTTLALGAGVAIVGGAEWAFAALVGGAAAALLSKKGGAELRQDLRARSHELIDEARRRLHRGGAAEPPPAEPQQPHS